MPKIDLTGGIDPAVDYLLSDKPENPDMAESVSMWFSDDEGRIGLPRFSIEAVAGQWDDRGVEANIAFPDGRVLIGAGGFSPQPPKIVGGKTVTLNAGPLTFEVVEPFTRWNMTFDGDAYETTIQDQERGKTGGSLRRVRVEMQTVSSAPPWTPGERAARADDSSTTAAFGAVGGHRHEQLFRCSGRVQIGDEPEIDFKGRGLKIRRTGVRQTGDFPGHCWHSALFPSGKAFGLIAFPPRSDGTPAYSEAFIFDGKRKIYGDVIEAPWLTEFVPHGGPLGIVIETDEGRVHIGGKTYDSTFITEDNHMYGNWSGAGAVGMPFHQGGALYTWDGESAYGMVERSLPRKK